MTKMPLTNTSSSVRPRPAFTRPARAADEDDAAPQRSAGGGERRRRGVAARMQRRRAPRQRRFLVREQRTIERCKFLPSWSEARRSHLCRHSPLLGDIGRQRGRCWRRCGGWSARWRPPRGRCRRGGGRLLLIILAAQQVGLLQKLTIFDIATTTCRSTAARYHLQMTTI
jgi:hypothetical protein